MDNDGNRHERGVETASPRYRAKQGKEIGEFVQEALFTYVEDIEDGVMAYVALKEDGLEHFLTEGVTPVALDASIYEASRKTA